MTETPQASAVLDALEGHEFMNLITYRRSGQAVVTPVWFARGGDCLFVMTIDGSGKIRRIRHTAAVDIGPSDRAGKPLGPTAPAVARILDEHETKRADELLAAKYGMMKRVFDAANAVRRTKRVYLEIALRGNGDASTAST